MMAALTMPRGTVTAPLKVAVEASDPVQQAVLAALVVGAGHHAVPAADAELVIADGTVTTTQPLLVLSDAPDDPAVAGWLPRTLTPAQLDAALRAVAAGLIVRLPGVAGLEPAEDDRPLLTPRELDILSCLGDGLSNKAAARRLGISQHTVKFHLEAIFDKLDANSRAEAVAKGLRRGLIEM